MATEPTTRAIEPESVDGKLVELLAALGTPLPRSGLLEWFIAVNRGLRGSRALGTREVRAAIDRLTDRGIVALTEHGRAFVVDAQRHAILESAHRAKRLKPLITAIRRVEPVRAQYSWQPDFHALSRELAWALHVGLQEDAAKEYADCRSSASGQAARELALLEGWGLQPPAHGLSLVPPQLVADYVRVVSENALLHLQPIGDPVVTWTEQHAAEVDSIALNGLAMYLVLRGVPERAEALVAALDDARSWGTRAFIALASNDFSAARELARKALERTRTKTSKRIKGLEADIAVWLVLALLTDRDTASHPYARAQLELERKVNPTKIVASLEMLDDLVSSGVDSLPDRSQLFQSTETIWLDVLFYALLTRFRGKPVTRALSQRLRAFEQHADQSGFSWVARELAAVAQAAPAKSLLQLYAVEAPWQRTLRALEVALAEGHASAAASSDEERLVWMIALEKTGSFQLSARLQTRTQNGWSGGRQVAWKRLAEAPPSTPYISDQDRRILRHIRVDREYSRYGSTPHYVLAPHAALELVGHPCVFADGDCRAPVEVARGVARIEVRPDADGSILTLSPEALLNHSMVCEREGSGRLVLYALDDAQTRVSRVFGGAPIRLPADAQDAQQHTLAKLANRFSVASEHAISAAHIEEVSADGRPRVRLRRSAGAIAIRVCVVPLPEAPAFVPGQGSARLILQVTAGPAPTNVCAVRDLEAERTALQALYARCPTLRDAVSGEHEGKLEELEQCLELLCELRAAQDVLVEWPEGEALALANERDLAHVRLRLEADTDWLGADGELEIDDKTRMKLHELLARAAAARGRFIALDDGRYLALTDKLKKTLDGMGALATLDDTRVKLHPLWLGIAGLRDDFAELKCNAQAKRWMERVREAGQLSPSLPRGFEAELREYQREGFEWLCRLAHMRAGACLADDMGLGKTLQALALLAAEATHGPALVVAPTSVCANWRDEACRFAPGLRLHELTNADRADTIRGLGAHDVLVCSYGLMQQEIETLSAKHFRVVILDEAQSIKNVSTQRARAAQQLVGDIRLALTGTPVENHLGELWSIMHFLNPGLLGTLRAFEERFGKPIARDSDARAARTLKRLIRPFVLRRRKSEVLEDLPPKTVITLRVQPSDAERALFAAMRERALAKLSAPNTGPTSETRIQLLAELTRLRRAACHPKLVVPEGDLASSKLEAFETLLAELRDGGHRTLVFSQFVDYLALVRARLDALGVSYQYLDGSCSTTARTRAVTAFQAGEGDVFLISLRAGGFGLNLTAADYVVHLDPWWNPAVEEQASDRAHRIGQSRPVTIYRLVMQDSIEEKILALHHDKRDLADRLLEGTSSASTLSLAELMALFQPEQEGEADAAR